MKYNPLCILLIAISASLVAQAPRQEGTIVRMTLAPCDAEHGFVAAMSGGGKVDESVLCPEYVLVSERVVYVIGGRRSETLLPLAEVTRFRLQKNEMLIRIEDADKESRFHIRAMMLRQDWEHSQKPERGQPDERAVKPAAIRDQH
ncbi:MAG TPA: hypothetical protein VMH04_16035 [Candidatus Solibacter sp.]|nr:hypothetical protein [Candidatus Solibacter sp.]